MKTEIEALLSRIKSGDVDETDIENAIKRLKETIKNDAAQGKELGILLSQINQTVKAKTKHKELNWVRVSNGFVAIGHKPGGKISYEGLKNDDTAAVLTLLQANEGAADIGKQVTNVGMEWIWFPFSASNPHSGDKIVDVIEIYTRLRSHLDAGRKIYIHCSAGIHRTGMITYGLLRFLGHDKAQAQAQLHGLRDVTAAQVGEDRLIWGDQFDASGS